MSSDFPYGLWALTVLATFAVLVGHVMWLARAGFETVAIEDRSARLAGLRRLRRAGFVCICAQTLVFLVSSIAGEVLLTGLSILYWVFGYVCALFAHNQVSYPARARLRRLTATRADALKFGLRMFSSQISLYVGYGVISTVVGFLLHPWIGFAATPIAVLAGLFAIAYVSPVFVRWMMPCRAIEDPALIEWITEVFARAEMPVPSLWFLEIDRFQSHNAMVAGLSWGRGPCRPGLFITRSLVRELSRAELEAVLLHELSHLKLHHVRKRMLAGLAAFLIALSVGLVAFSVLQDWLPVAMMSGLTALWVGVNIAFQLYLVRHVVRRQELEADESAVRMGASLEALASALLTLTRLNDQSETEKDPTTYLNPAAAHPTPRERIDLLTARRSQGFPAHPPLHREVLTWARRQARVSVIATFLIAIGIGIHHHRNVAPLTALAEAIQRGDRAEVRRLAVSEYVLSVPHPSTGWTPLMWAATTGDVEILRELVQLGAAVRGVNRQGLSALHAAAIAGRSEAARALLEAGADLDARTEHGSTALGIAAERGDASLVSLLLAHGARTDFADGDGDTALSMAQRGGFQPIVKLLTSARSEREPAQAAALESDVQDRRNGEESVSAGVE